jgi:tripartite-type tricarboxylate transporter receptor subunit TctC
LPIDRRTALKFAAGSALLGGVQVLPSRAVAQQYPDRPIRIIVPFPAGGPYDLVTRAVAHKINARHGWTIVTDNRGGASGTIGIVAAKQSPPDGYTLATLNAGTHGATPAVKRNLGYDPLKDLTPLVLLADASLVLLVRQDLPVRAVAELIQLLRDKPGQLNYSSGGFGSQHHLGALMFLVRAGLPQTAAVHVPFQGLVPALTALVAGNVQFMITTTGAATQHIASGKLRPLASTGSRRSPRLPDVPTMQELGFPDFEVTVWCGLGAPAGTPEAVLALWNKAANEALADPEVRKQIAGFDYDARGGTAAEFAAFVARDVARWKKLADDTGLIPE